MIVYLPMFPLTALVSSFFFTPRHPNPDWLVWIGRFLMLGAAAAVVHFVSRPRWRELRQRRLRRDGQ